MNDVKATDSDEDEFREEAASLAPPQKTIEDQSDPQINIK